jgi:hypothetical protein
LEKSKLVGLKGTMQNGSNKCYPLKLGQPPALGQEWHFEAGAGGSLTTAAKLENCFSTFFSPHSGHAGAFADADETSTSFTNPHFVHLYSKIGISSSCLI